MSYEYHDVLEKRQISLVVDMNPAIDSLTVLSPIVSLSRCWESLCEQSGLS